MKKLVLTAAVLGFAASMASAQVYSQNIVGYAKTTLAADSLEMLSLQFSGTNGTVTLENSFSGLGSGSVVYMWNGGGYNAYTYYGVNGWYDSLNQPADSVEVDSGVAVWVKDAGEGADAITAGEVPSADSVVVEISAGLNMVANPYPTTMKLSDNPSGLASVAKAYVWSGIYSSYTFYGENGWYDSLNQPAADVEIGVGEGLWLSVAAPASLSFSKGF
jgi:hypothetical protein